MSSILVVSYTLFSFFVFYQQLHVKNYRGASQGFGSFLTLFSFVAMLAGFAFLIYYSYQVSWLGALALFGISLAVKFVWFALEAKLGIRAAAPFISLTGFLGIPVCAYFAWASFPR